MRILQLTPGAGPMYCGNCLRDNALVTALRRQGHQAIMVPLYLPLTLDEPDQSAELPIFFSGISVFLEQKAPWFRTAPRWVHGILSLRLLLRWAAGRAAKTRPTDAAELTLSMLRGEEGNQRRELEELVVWLKAQPKPDVICLSNALLLGMARQLKRELAVPLVCMLQGEDSFLDALPERSRGAAWQLLASRAAEVDLFVAPSRYFAKLMQRRLGLRPERVAVVHNGINLEGYQPKFKVQSSGFEGGKDVVAEEAQVTGTDHPARASALAARAGISSPAPPRNCSPPVLGYFTRMCREKGLDVLVEAYIRLRQRGQVPGLKLRVGGSCGPSDKRLVEELCARLKKAGLREDAEFQPNLTRKDKLAFLQSLSVFSVPALYGEAFGLYVLEALAAGVPVVQPDSGAFGELIEATGGGLVCAPGNPEALAEALEELLLNPERAQALGEAGQRSVFQKFSAEAMAQGMLAVVKRLKR